MRPCFTERAKEEQKQRDEKQIKWKEGKGGRSCESLNLCLHALLILQEQVIKKCGCKAAGLKRES